MARQVTDFTGRRFGKLTAVRIVELCNHRATWELCCDCGETVTKTSKQILETNKKTLKMMCDYCRLSTYTHPEKTKLWRILYGDSE
jgi:hypothetical protein